MSRWRYLLLCLVFWLSGAAALMYEVSWTRQLGEILGHTSRSAGVVLAAYFGGLAIGYEFGGRWSSRISPLRGYALAELVAALWATIVPHLLDAIGSPAMVRGLAGGGETVAVFWQTCLCLLLLLPATVALGATWPFMSEAVTDREARGTPQRAILAYSTNTCGAMTGAALASSVLLYQVGVRHTGFLAAGLSLLCAAAAALLARSRSAISPAFSEMPNLRHGASQRMARDSVVDSALGSSGRFNWSITLAAAVSGFAVLALEVLYFRLFALVFHNSSYSFGAILTAFLFGLSFAAAVAAWCMRRWPSSDLSTFSMWSGAVAVGVSVILFQRLTQLDYVEAQGGFAAYLTACLMLVLQVILAPALLTGMILPGLWGEVLRRDVSPGRLIGRLTTVNTVAAGAGSLVCSFWLLPQLGLWRAFAAIAGLLGLTAVMRLGLRKRWLAASLCLFATLAGLPLLFKTSSEPTGVVRDGERVVKHWDSAYGWIDVVENSATGVLDVRQNVHYRYGSTGEDLVRERRQAHLPLLLHPRPREVLFLGLGTGVTAAGAMLHADVERISVVELIPEVVEAAWMLATANLGIVDHPRVTIAVDDARHFLLATERSFDVVVGDLFVPWESETGYLYSREHFERVHHRLKEGGLFCQWLALYQVGTDDFTMIADTFATVFPNCTLWWGHLDAQRPIIALVGVKGEVTLSQSTLIEKVARLTDVDGFSDDALDTSEHVLAMGIGAWTASDGSLLNTVEHPRIEFLTPRSQQDDLLLEGNNLQVFFDRVLRKLPPMTASAFGQILDSPPSSTSQIAVQRFILFGRSEP